MFPLLLLGDEVVPVSCSVSLGSKAQPLLDDDGIAVNGHRAVNVPGGSVNTKRSLETEAPKTTKFGIPIQTYKSVKWAMIIAIALMWMQQLSGINAVCFTFSAQRLPSCC